MIVHPKMRGFICTTAHPVGCNMNVRHQAEYARQHKINGPKRVLVIGSSGGYGLACRLTAAFSCKADTVGVFFDRPASGSRTATAGWYNNVSFEKLAGQDGCAFISINGDAYSDEVKKQTIEAIKSLPGGQVDLVIYSLAAPNRVNPRDGQKHSSVIKPVGKSFTGKTVDFHTGQVYETSISPASEDEIAGTVAVMGGEDWLFWIEELKKSGSLAPKAATMAFSYIGPTLTHDIYKDGTIGRAKEDLEEKCTMINSLLAQDGGRAYVAVNKGLVTQASSAIPVVPLYISLIYKLMKEKGSHEGCIEQMVRLFERVYSGGSQPNWDSIPVDEKGRIRMDDWEMDDSIQSGLDKLWAKVSTENLEELTDIAGYREDFYRMFGFGIKGVDYQADVEI